MAAACTSGEVLTTGIKAWQFRYRHAGKQQTYTIGKASKSHGLAWARDEADKARSRVEEGDHLTRVKAVKKASKRAAAANTFGIVAAEWVKAEARRAKWTPAYKDEVSASIANHLSALDSLPISEITAPMAAPHLRKVERNAPDMSKKVRQRLRAILDEAVMDGLIPINPIPVPRRRKRGEERTHLPAVLEKKAVGTILRAADKAEVGKGVRRAHLMAVFTAQRIGEIVGATWDEMEMQSAVWSIPRDRMKRKDKERGPHLVPIPPGLVAMMREWHREDGVDRTYVCPTPRGNASITREAVEKFYRRGLKLTGKHSPHSWRSVLSTWANDAHQDSDAVEAQLDHAVGSSIRRSYDHSKKLDRRADLMAWHEQALIAARDGAEVVEFKRKA